VRRLVPGMSSRRRVVMMKANVAVLCVPFCALLVGVGLTVPVQAWAQSDVDTSMGAALPAAPSSLATPSKGRGLNLSEGRWGFGFGFPGGGNPMGSGYVGARYFVKNEKSIGGYLLLGSDSAARTNSFGLAGRYTAYFAQADRVHLFGFGQLSLGRNGGDANEDKDDLLIGVGGGAGVEFALLKDLSVSGEAGLSFNTLPDGENAIALGTSALALNFYF
jgi:hypothetical protein